MIAWPLKTYVRVEIHWVDSTSRTGWHRVDEFNEETKRAGGPMPMITTGFLIDQTKDYISVAGTIGYSKEDSLCGKACDFMTIPRGCIKKVKRLGIPKQL
jgi:hypothetical protein